MLEEKCWLKFILTGKAQDYLRYVEAKNQKFKEVDCYSLFNGCAGNKGNKYR